MWYIHYRYIQTIGLPLHTVGRAWREGGGTAWGWRGCGALRGRAGVVRRPSPRFEAALAVGRTLRAVLQNAKSERPFCRCYAYPQPSRSEVASRARPRGRRGAVRRGKGEKHHPCHTFPKREVETRISALAARRCVRALHLQGLPLLRLQSFVKGRDPRIFREGACGGGEGWARVWAGPRSPPPRISSAPYEKHPGSRARRAPRTPFQIFQLWNIGLRTTYEWSNGWRGGGLDPNRGRF